MNFRSILQRSVLWMKRMSNRRGEVLDLEVWENLNVWAKGKLLEVGKVLEMVVGQGFLVLSGSQRTRRPEILG